jgi:hypothetical protein
MGTVPWNPCGLFHGILMEWYMDLQLKFIEIPWNYMESNGPAHGIHMECRIPWTFHMDSIVGME